MAKEEKSSESGMKEITKIGILSLAKIMGVFGIIVGLVEGVMIGLAYKQLSSNPDLFNPTDPQVQYIMTTGWSNIIILPLIVGIFSFIIGILSALIYNFVAQKIGGIKIHLK